MFSQGLETSITTTSVVSSVLVDKVFQLVIFLELLFVTKLSNSEKMTGVLLDTFANSTFLAAWKSPPGM
jgi:hypothetical protein